SSDDMLSNINNIPNSEKLMFGQEQINWLKNSLLNSYAPFKIIVTGSQVLNEVEDGGDCFYNYPVEYNDLMNFLNVHKINGVIFLTGDKHHSEIIKKDREMAYPLYDVTVSSLTAGISKVKKEFINQSNRIPNTLVEEHNYGRFTVSGKPKERVLQVEFVNISGQSKSKWLISENDLRYNKK
ncbi:MAG TPA: alkaline phosphatase D family protein, partial [Saprospiraceae bacterium]|nr:alkaline phosphatase D family protein [Saprospiraceae bacterium]